MDAAGNVYVTGQTEDSDFPVTADAYQKDFTGFTGNGTSAFFTELNATGSALIYSTYLGGNGNYLSSGKFVTLDNLGNAYIAGNTDSPGFPITDGAYVIQNAATKGYCNGSYTVNEGAAFVSKFAFNGATTTALTSDSNPSALGEYVTFTAIVSSTQGESVLAGLIEIRIDGVVYGSGNLDGSWGLSLSILTTGTHTIEALYLGDSSHAASSGFLTQTITGQVAAPSFSPVGGTYRTSTVVTIKDATNGAVIHYTTDGSTPSATSPIYSTPLALTAPTTLKAIAVASGDTASPIASASYSFVSTAKPTTTSLVSSLATAYMDEPVTFTATVKTTDGTTPTGTVTFLHGGILIGSAALSG